MPSLTEIGADAFGFSIEIVRVDEVNSQMHAGSQVVGGLICTGWQELPAVAPAAEEAGAAPAAEEAAPQATDSLEQMESIVFTRADAKRLLNSSANGVVRIPDGVTEIAEKAFQSCNDLTSVQFPNGLTKIGTAAFDDCYKLTSVEFPNGLTEIGDSAFYGCRSLTSVEFPNGLTKIGNAAFLGCTNLISVQMPSLTEIGEIAFYGCNAEIVRVDEVNSQMHAGSQVMGGLICTVLQELPRATDSLEAAMQQDLIRVAGEVCEDGKWKRWV